MGQEEGEQENEPHRHRKNITARCGFRDELRQLLRWYEIEFDERYVWD